MNGTMNPNDKKHHQIVIDPFNTSNQNKNQDQNQKHQKQHITKENEPLLQNDPPSYGLHSHRKTSSISQSSNNKSVTSTNKSNKSRSRSQSNSMYNNEFLVYVDRFFKITERGSSITKELRGGTVGFLTLAYIVLLNPQVLSVSGIPYDYAASSTCFASFIATLICGIFGNIPVGCGPGVGLSAYFSYGMMPQILDEKYSATDPYLAGLFMAFLSGLIVFILTIPGIVTYIVGSLPQFIKIATIVGMGMFLAFVGMVDVKLVTANAGQGDAILQLGDITNWIVILALVNALLISILKYYKINGALLICIIITSCIYFGISQDWPTSFIDLPKFQNPLLVLNFNIIKHLPIQTAFESIISFVLILFLDVSGVTFAIAKLCGLSDNRKTLASFQKSAFIGTSIGSMIAAVLGCSPIIVCIETSSGAAAGARTGLSAVVMSLFFFVAMFLGPVIGKVPAAATSPVLIFIGTLMMGQVGGIAWDNMRIAIPAFLCIAMMPFTYSIANGLFFGVGAFFLTYLLTGQFLMKNKLFTNKFLTTPNGDTQTLDEKYKYSNSNPDNWIESKNDDDSSFDDEFRPQRQQQRGQSDDHRY